VKNITCVISRAIINDNKLQIEVLHDPLLMQDGFEGEMQMSARIINGQDDGHFSHGGIAEQE
jgi:hypothetical protein